MTQKIDGMVIAAFGFLIFLGTNLISDVATASPLPTTSATEINSPTTEPILVEQSPPTQEQPPAAESVSIDPTAFGAPYDSYVITQGPHGYSYGHMAIDLSAGEGAEILSPINGSVSELYVDEYGNPKLIIENEVYRVLLMHGNYTVAIGQSVSLGEVIGSESNQGYTKDMAGNLCWGRAGCGFHSHFNVFDKRVGQNVNPLDLLP